MPLAVERKMNLTAILVKDSLRHIAASRNNEHSKSHTLVALPLGSRKEDPEPSLLVAMALERRRLLTWRRRQVLAHKHPRSEGSDRRGLRTVARAGVHVFLVQRQSELSAATRFALQIV
jgi:hypothetical protein